MSFTIKSPWVASPVTNVDLFTITGLPARLVSFVAPTDAVTQAEF